MRWNIIFKYRWKNYWFRLLVVTSWQKESKRNVKLKLIGVNVTWRFIYFVYFSLFFVVKFIEFLVEKRRHPIRYFGPICFGNFNRYEFEQPKRYVVTIIKQEKFNRLWSSLEIRIYLILFLQKICESSTHSRCVHIAGNRENVCRFGQHEMRNKKKRTINTTKEREQKRGNWRKKKQHKVFNQLVFVY